MATDLPPSKHTQLSVEDDNQPNQSTALLPLSTEDSSTSTDQFLARRSPAAIAVIFNSLLLTTAAWLIRRSGVEGGLSGDDVGNEKPNKRWYCNSCNLTEKKFERKSYPGFNYRNQTRDYTVNVGYLYSKIKRTLKEIPV